MVKPALPYLDILAEARQLAGNYPLACYQASLHAIGLIITGLVCSKVSGEYAMVVAGAKAGVYDLKDMAFETHTAMLRAGRFPPLTLRGDGKLILLLSFRSHSNT